MDFVKTSNTVGTNLKCVLDPVLESGLGISNDVSINPSRGVINTNFPMLFLRRQI